MVNTWWKFLLVKNLCNLNSIKTIFLFSPCILILNPNDATRRCGDENHIAYIGIGGKEEDRTKTANVTEGRRNQPSSFQFALHDRWKEFPRFGRQDPTLLLLSSSSRRAISRIDTVITGCVVVAGYHVLWLHVGILISMDRGPALHRCVPVTTRCRMDFKCVPPLPPPLARARRR